MRAFSQTVCADEVEVRITLPLASEKLVMDRLIEVAGYGWEVAGLRRRPEGGFELMLLSRMPKEQTVMWHSFFFPPDQAAAREGEGG